MNRGHTLHDPRYNPAALEKHLHDQLGETLLSDINNAELLVPSYAIRLPKLNQSGSLCAPMFFRSWQARGLRVEGGNKNEYDFKLTSIACHFGRPDLFSAGGNRQQSGPRLHDD